MYSFLDKCNICVSFMPLQRGRRKVHTITILMWRNNSGEDKELNILFNNLISKIVSILFLSL